jgi:hypothetical protein
MFETIPSMRQTLGFEASEPGERKMKRKIKVTKSSGNVFADIGIPNAAEHSIKADLAMIKLARP